MKKYIFLGRFSLCKENDETLSVIMSFKRREHPPHLNSTALRAPVSLNAPTRQNVSSCQNQAYWQLRTDSWAESKTTTLHSHNGAAGDSGESFAHQCAKLYAKAWATQVDHRRHRDRKADLHDRVSPNNQIKCCQCATACTNWFVCMLIRPTYHFPSGPVKRAIVTSKQKNFECSFKNMHKKKNQLELVRRLIATKGVAKCFVQSEKEPSELQKIAGCNIGQERLPCGETRSRSKPQKAIIYLTA